MSVVSATPYWPRHLPPHLTLPRLTLWQMLVDTARRFPDQPVVNFFGHEIPYREFVEQAEALAGWLVHEAGVKRGDRVMVYLQNSAQWMLAHFAIQRVDAVLVPVSPMNRAPEVAHYLADSGARVAICGQDLLPQLQAAAGEQPLDAIVVATYRDCLPEHPEYDLPDWLLAPREPQAGTTAWHEALACERRAPAPQADPQDVCALPYTSGSTGKPKACIHTHASLMHNIAGQALWHVMSPGTPCLGLVPMYHVSGLMHALHLPVYSGGTVVVLPRWNRRLGLQLLHRERIGHASLPPTAIIDIFSKDDWRDYDLSALRRVTAGGASMPREVWDRMESAWGLPFIEGYGLTETAATTHLNPVFRPRQRSGGVPFFDTEAAVIDPESGQRLAQGETGEIVVRGPQLFQGYWNRPEATAEVFIELDGRRWFRTGDIGHADDEGYYFITDRAKRMINASGLKVYPAEVEAAMYAHPLIQEVCVIGAPDAYRGETVKVFVILTAEGRGTLTAEDLIAWCRERMAAYKYPRIVEFVDSLPKSAVGKILWRELQEAERRRAGQ